MLRHVLAATAATIAVTGLAVHADRTPDTTPVAAGSARVAGEPAEVAARRAVVRPARTAGPARPRSAARAHPRDLSRPLVPVPRPRPADPLRWGGVPFATPEAAMRFLVTAYKRLDDVALRHVTTPDARTNLVAMRDVAPELRLASCARLETGAYDCVFTHSTPSTTRQTGHALFRVAPATRPGWYMTVLAECGD